MTYNIDHIDRSLLDHFNQDFTSKCLQNRPAGPESVAMVDITKTLQSAREYVFCVPVTPCYATKVFVTLFILIIKHVDSHCLPASCGTSL